MTNYELFINIKHGDDTAILELFNKLDSFIRTKLENADDVDDIMQSIYCNILECINKLPSNTTVSYFNASLYRTIDNTIKDANNTMCFEVNELYVIDPFEISSDRELERVFTDMLNTLTERELEVLKLRFGVYNGKEYTYEQVARMFGVTRERIRQIENKAIRKLRHPNMAKKIKDLYL